MQKQISIVSSYKYPQNEISIDSRILLNSLPSFCLFQGNPIKSINLVLKFALEFFETSCQINFYDPYNQYYISGINFLLGNISISKKHFLFSIQISFLKIQSQTSIKNRDSASTTDLYPFNEFTSQIDHLSNLQSTEAPDYNQRVVKLLKFNANRPGILDEIYKLCNLDLNFLSHLSPCGWWCLEGLCYAFLALNDYDGALKVIEIGKLYNHSFLNSERFFIQKKIASPLNIISNLSIDSDITLSEPGFAFGFWDMDRSPSNLDTSINPTPNGLGIMESSNQNSSFIEKYFFDEFPKNDFLDPQFISISIESFTNSDPILLGLEILTKFDQVYLNESKSDIKFSFFNVRFTVEKHDDDNDFRINLEKYSNDESFDLYADQPSGFSNIPTESQQIEPTSIKRSKSKNKVVKSRKKRKSSRNNNSNILENSNMEPLAGYRKKVEVVIESFSSSRDDHEISHDEFDTDQEIEIIDLESNPKIPQHVKLSSSVFSKRKLNSNEISSASNKLRISSRVRLNRNNSTLKSSNSSVGKEDQNKSAPYYKDQQSVCADLSPVLEFPNLYSSLISEASCGQIEGNTVSSLESDSADEVSKFDSSCSSHYSSDCETTPVIKYVPGSIYSSENLHLIPNQKGVSKDVSIVSILAKKVKTSITDFNPSNIDIDKQNFNKSVNQGLPEKCVIKLAEFILSDNDNIMRYTPYSESDSELKDKSNDLHQSEQIIMQPSYFVRNYISNNRPLQDKHSPKVLSTISNKRDSTIKFKNSQLVFDFFHKVNENQMGLSEVMFELAILFAENPDLIALSNSQYNNIDPTSCSFLSRQGLGNYQNLEFDLIFLGGGILINVARDFVDPSLNEVYMESKPCELSESKTGKNTALSSEYTDLNRIKRIVVLCLYSMDKLATGIESIIGKIIEQNNSKSNDHQKDYGTTEPRFSDEFNEHSELFDSWLKFLNENLVHKSLKKVDGYFTNTSFNISGGRKSGVIYDKNSTKPFTLNLYSLLHDSDFKIPNEEVENISILIQFLSNQIINRFSEILLKMTITMPVYNKSQIYDYYRFKKTHSTANSATVSDTGKQDVGTNEIIKDQFANIRDLHKQKLTNDVYILINKDDSFDAEDKISLYWELLLVDIVPIIWLKTITIGWNFLGIFCESQISTSSGESLFSYVELINNIHNLLCIFGLCNFSTFSFRVHEREEYIAKYKNGQELNRNGFCGFCLDSSRRLIFQNYDSLKANSWAKTKNNGYMNQSITGRGKKNFGTRSSSPFNETQLIERDNEIKPNLYESFLCVLSQSIFCSYEITIDFKENVWWEPENHIKPNGLIYSYVDSIPISDNISEVSCVFNDLLIAIKSGSRNFMDVKTASLIYFMICNYVFEALSLNKVSQLRSHKNILEPLFLPFGMYQSDSDEIKEFTGLNHHQEIREVKELKKVCKDNLPFFEMFSYNLNNIGNLLEEKIVPIESLLAIIDTFLENDLLLKALENPSLSSKVGSADRKLMLNGSLDYENEYNDLVNKIGIVNILEPKNHMFDEDIVLKCIRSMFFINASVQRELIKPRLKSGNPIKISSEYIYIIQLLFINVSISPSNWANWYHLGLAFVERADIMSVLTEDQIESYLTSISSAEDSDSMNERKNLKKPLKVSQSNCYSSVRNCLSSGLICFTQAICLLTAEIPGLISQEILPLTNLETRNHNPKSKDFSISDPSLINANIIDLLFYIGHILYRLASNPIYDKFLKESSFSKNRENNDNLANEKTESNEKAFPRNLIFLVSGNIYKLLSRIFKVEDFKMSQSENVTEWFCYYMSGKCLSKIGKPKEACIMYLKSIYSTIGILGDEETKKIPEISYSFDKNLGNPKFFRSLNDHSILPCLKVLSTLSKLVYRKEICICYALRFIQNLPDGPRINEVERNYFSDDSLNNKIMENRSRFSGSPKKKGNNVRLVKSKIGDRICPSCDSPKAIIGEDGFFRLILDCLKSILAMDKRKWHHKPHFLISWIYFYVYSSYKESKEAISAIINFKNSSKTIYNFYKTEFESPGKFYSYLEKYVLFSIKLNFLLSMTKQKNLSIIGTGGFNSLQSDPDIYYQYPLNLPLTFSRKVLSSEHMFMDKDLVFKECNRSLLVLIMSKMLNFYKKSKILKSLQIKNQTMIESIIKFYFEETKKSRKSKNSNHKTSNGYRQIIDESISVKEKLILLLPFENILKVSLNLKKLDICHQNFISFATYTNILIREIARKNSHFISTPNSVNLISSQKSQKLGNKNEVGDLLCPNDHIHNNDERSDRVNSPSIVISDSPHSHITHGILNNNVITDERDSLNQGSKSTKFISHSEQYNIVTEDIHNAKNTYIYQRNPPKSFQDDSGKNMEFILMVYSELVAGANIMSQFLGQLKKSINTFPSKFREFDFIFSVEKMNPHSSLETDKPFSEVNNRLGNFEEIERNSQPVSYDIYAKLDSEFLETISFDMYCRFLETFGNFSYKPLTDQGLDLETRVKNWVSYFNDQSRSNHSVFQDLAPEPSDISMDSQLNPTHSQSNKPYFLDKYLAKIYNPDVCTEKTSNDCSKVSKYDLIKNINSFVDAIYDEKVRLKPHFLLLKHL
ncbi:Histone transcription regulator 3-like protein [Smittium mucronatum]|uniref:Histone transcription regulator 3-like protein n=1 Tax=Smittium mucronatum TaxID=133383 RepID=A0A1R0H538_9FUNG|nr:Histone transcription regulator 3-like protein [Smittium mucronatum]